METTHRVVVGDARSLASIDDESVELVITSPPYPMIEMWDELFAELDPAIETALEAGDGDEAFSLMHDQLARVWDEVSRVLVDGGIACVNVGDATRSIGDRFRVYQNHARVATDFESRGFDPLPDVLWRKPTNSAAKFMGSGMLAPNAYVTLEHEHVLIFRKAGGSRSFEPGANRRYEAAYFWEERNRWFSDLWSDVTGELQQLGADGARDRSAAFPFEIPYRLCCMYSVYGDTVLDPFWGTGTTSLAAMCAGRSSIGVELDEGLVSVFDERVGEVQSMATDVGRRRLARHRDFVASRRDEGASLSYESSHYDFPVTTSQERDLRLYSVESVERERLPSGRRYRLDHTPLAAE
ncbi:DNA modification methylase [Halovivax ruber XH-70]|uniref:Type II methyltransferase n=1 Tax=Halovivax ruber (strain DSM 18193 / JCM 13892 / XH-70) TaxID=797302 RepID=L0I9Y8_HALRX|nr:site-specific DNA-methyltransferase [Halovivax ruber]AGB16395.1 DNA modification methylase [Halovivax ruber XH-70]